MMFTLLTVPSNVSTLIKNSICLYTTNLRKVSLLSFLAMLSFLIPIYLPFLSEQTRTTSLPTNNSEWLITGICWFIALVIASGLLFYLHCLYYGIRNTLPKVLKHALSRSFILLVVGIFYVAFVFSGTMLLLIPGFILSISLMFSFLLALNENKGALQSLLVSHKLVWGHWWHTFLTISIPVIINAIMSMILFLGIALMVMKLPSLGMQHYILIFATQLILHTVLMPFPFCVALVLLNDLRIRKNLSKRPY